MEILENRKQDKIQVGEIFFVKAKALSSAKILEIAYLDNQLFDFANKGKAK